MPLNIHKAEKPKVDLTNKNSLSAWLKNHAKELWNAFGSPPSFRDYDPQKVIDFIKNGISSDKVYISPEKEKEVIDTIKSKGKNGRSAMQYVSNLYLKGAGLGVRDQKEELLRQTIREIIEGELNSFAKKKKLQDKNKKPVKTTVSQKNRFKSAKKANWSDKKDNKLESIIREEIQKILKEDVDYYKKIQAAQRMKDSLQNRLNNEKGKKPTFKKGSEQGNFTNQYLQKRIDSNKAEIDALKIKKRQQDQNKRNKLEQVIKEEIKKILKEAAPYWSAEERNKRSQGAYGIDNNHKFTKNEILNIAKKLGIKLSTKELNFFANSAYDNKKDLEDQLLGLNDSPNY